DGEGAEALAVPAGALGEDNAHDGDVDAVLEGVAVVGLDGVEPGEDLVVHELFEESVDVLAEGGDALGAAGGSHGAGEALGLQVLLDGLDRRLAEILAGGGDGLEG